MRVATFNIESLDLPARGGVRFEVRATALRPVLERLAADILCLQEVDGQHVPGAPERRLVALDMLLEGTRYASYHRAATSGADGRGVASVHNLVTLSRFPIRERREVRHQYTAPLLYGYVTGSARGGTSQPIGFDRPLLLTEIELPSEGNLDVINVHLRAPRASAVPGEKMDSATWRTTSGWAEGYFISSLKRTAQALELRLLVDEMLDRQSDRLLAVAGDFNAEDHETPLRLVAAAEDDTGNGRLAAQSLLVLDQALPAERRWSVLHGGRREMLDHILASRALYRRFRSIGVHNEGIVDEAIVAAGTGALATSSHAPVVAEFGWDEAPG
jgi:endonuclease/exonuclease/phosphatase family metal-dependent hydrolase